MAERFDSWESYFYPETYDARIGQGVMRNLLGWRDRDALSGYEYRMTGVRQRQLVAQPDLVAHTFDAAHVRAIHRYLFQDVYEWAGQYRTVNMSKGFGRGFGDVDTGEVDRYLADVRRLVERTPWAGLNRQEFGEQAATVFAYLNQAHPFREGNGRTSKVFMEHVSQLSGYTLDFDRVTPVEWNKASEFSRPDLDSYEPVPDSLVPVFQHLAVERAVAGAHPAEDVVPAHSLLSASYPRPATEVTGPGGGPAPAPPASGAYRPGRSAGPGRGE